MEDLIRDLRLVAGAEKLVKCLFYLKNIILAATAVFALAEAIRLAIKNKDVIGQKLTILD